MRCLLSSEFVIGAATVIDIFIVQDDVNDVGNQNFKIISWGEIASIFNPPLEINNGYDLRN